jgi:hypothetical protein
MYNFKMDTRQEFRDIFNKKIVLFIVSCILQAIVFSNVITRNVSLISLLLWTSSLVCFFIAFPFSEKTHGVRNVPTFTKIPVAAIVITGIALAIRVSLMLNEATFHVDEYLTAHFSYSLGNILNTDWFGVYPPKGVWVSQFPSVYFVFQKLFFNIFGLSTLTMRLSILPYVFVTFLFLFLIVKIVYGELSAYISIILLATFPPDIYLTQRGLHFISATAFFLATTYFLLLSIQSGKKLYFALTGVFLGLSYMTYYSSYVTAPLLFLYIIGLFIKKQLDKKFLQNFILTLGIAAYMLSPLLVYATQVDNFFTERTAQVKLINGEWSPYKNIEETPAAVFEIVKTQTILSVQSLYKDGVGGHGGYFFGQLALFDPITLVFLFLGTGYFILRIIQKKDVASFFILATIVATFIGGMVLTIPPPAYHRTSLAFPFITLILAVFIVDIYTFFKAKQSNFAPYILSFCVFALIASNFFHFKAVLAHDTLEMPVPDYTLIENDLENTQGSVYIAAFDSYALGKVLFIRSKGERTFITAPLEDVLKEAPQNQSSYIVILYPDETSLSKVQEVFPHAKIVNSYQWHLLIKT